MNKYTQDQLEVLGAVIYRASDWFVGAGYGPFDNDQIDCLQDYARAEEARGMLDDMVARLGLDARIVAPAYAVLASDGTAADILKAYPNIEREYPTGGNCTAWRLECDGFEYLITTPECAYEPDPESVRVIVSMDCLDRSDTEACSRLECDSAALSIPDALAWLEENGAQDYMSESERQTACQRSNQLGNLTELLRNWCAAEGLPFGCADELRSTIADYQSPQRVWLDAYCTLWELTDK